MKSLMDVRNKIKASIVGQMQSLSDRMSAGRATDYAAYRQMVGQMHGLKEAMDSVDEVFNQLLDEQDD